MSAAGLDYRFLKLGGVDIEVGMQGAGSPVLVLAGEEQLENTLPLIGELAKSHQVVVPSAPGFGKSARPDWMTNPDDIAYLYLDLIDAMALKSLAVVGFSLGGWIAAEMAVKNDRAFSKLALVDPYGVKIGGPFDVDIQDIWTSHPDKVAALKWYDRTKGERDFTKMSDDELSIVARNIESFARFCWDPYMHNPKLKQRLHRIKTPTLFIWGENDGIVTPAYGKAYAGLVPGAKFASIAEAGHYPHIEQPAAFNKILTEFLG
ncbi:alpha/beta hydrolase [Roseiarcaceae bacterium H3SJ34-1]|uniref:alpha/beta fold hydrolase n=1 Tax=Terripilifer ovatus TaxID=3032367 RepID=UPI003AB97E7B|nr:alpha/beta hydrolase [Roseiarcaceae bacterium H3SJ34-1]